MKLLFLYFGQPRMVKECIPWQDDFFNFLYMIDGNIEIDLEYHLWNEHFDRLRYKARDSFSEFNCFKKIDTTQYEKIIKTNRLNEFNIKCNFYDYNIVYDLWNKIEHNNNDLDKNLFCNLFAQTISKGIASQNLSDDYDMVVLLRTDLVFNKEKYSTFYKHIKQYIKNLTLSNFTQSRMERHMCVPWLKFLNGIGAAIDDCILYTTPNALKEFYSHYDKKILKYINDSIIAGHNEFTKHETHNLAVNFGNFYEIDNKTPIVIIEKPELAYNFYSIARPIDEVRNIMNEPNSVNFNKIHNIFEELKRIK